MISLPQALARAVGTTNVYAAGHAVADWFDGRNCSGAADLIREHLRDQSNQPAPDAVPHNRPDTSLRSELMAKLATQREVLLSICDRVDRLEMRADGLTPIERVERRWAKERSVKESLTVGGNGQAVSDAREPVSVAGEPTDAELLGLDQLAEAWNAQADAANGWNELGLDEIIVWAQRQALARYGHQPAPPVKGELAELVEFLKGEAHSRQCNGHDYLAKEFARAAELLQQRHPEPVPISERLPGAEDCDEDGRCWLFSKVEKEWRLLDVGNPGVPHLRYCFSHSLPATALPLPQQETPQ